MPIYAPYVIERSSRGERTYDIFSRLLMDRIVFLGSGINDEVANVVIAQLLFLEAENPERDINIYINSPGGSVQAGLAIYDTMQFLNAPVATICMGMAASMGAFLLAAGTKGKRRALPNSRIMIHQPSGGPTARHPTSRSRRRRSCTRASASMPCWRTIRGRRWIRSPTTWIETGSCRLRRRWSTVSSTTWSRGPPRSRATGAPRRRIDHGSGRRERFSHDGAGLRQVSEVEGSVRHLIRGSGSDDAKR